MRSNCIPGRSGRGTVTLCVSDAQVRPHAFARRFRRLADQAGLPRIRVHDVRHSVATILVDSGKPIPSIAAALGHDPAVLLRTYSHPSVDSVRATMDALAVAVGER